MVPKRSLNKTLESKVLFGMSAKLSANGWLDSTFIDHNMFASLFQSRARY